MSKKSDQISKFLKKIELPYTLPSTEVPGTLLEQGLYAVLLRELPDARAVATVQALRKAYDDYNEARVAQVQELAEAVAPKGKGVGRLARYLPAARLIKAYLQEVFQKTHGLDFDFLLEDAAFGTKILSQMSLVGTSVSSYLLFLAERGEIPVAAGLVQTLDRLGLMKRTTSVRKARDAMEIFFPEDSRLEVAFSLGYVVDRWCEPRKPSCWDCPLLDDCPTGKKIHKEWKVQQERLRKQHEKEAARRLSQEKRDAERLVREAERERKRLEAEEKKRQRLEERAARERARKEAEEQKKRLAQEKAEEKKKAGQKQKAQAKKKATKKKTVKKKVAKKAAKKSTKKSTTKKKSKTKTTSGATGRKASGKG